jgi:steroid delta-isomerase-like uncharacterized protein
MGKYLSLTLTAAMIVCFVLGCQQQQQPQGITEEEARMLMNRFMDITKDGNVDQDLIDELFDPNCVFKYPASPEPMTGTENFKKFSEQNIITFPDFGGKIEDIAVKGNEIWSRFTISATNLGPLGEMPATGKKVQITGMGITRVIDGKIVEDETFWNVLSFYQQLGFTLTPPEVDME